MNFNEEFRKLIPTIVSEIKRSYKDIGESYTVPDEDGYSWESEYEDNAYLYDKDGWFIEVLYRCTGDPGKSAWGEVTEINTCHEDEEVGDEVSEELIDELWGAVNGILAHFIPMS